MTDQQFYGLMPDKWISEMVASHGMIHPFAGEQVREDSNGGKVISYGVSSYGYDVRVADEFKVFERVTVRSQIGDMSCVNDLVVDPKNLDARCLREVKGDCVIPPNGFALCRSVEKFKIPRDTTVVVLGKSSYARVGLVVNVTPLESGWEGYVTIEVSNTTPLPAIVYANEGIAQCLFFRSSLECKTSYADRNGKYQHQLAEITLPRV